MHAQLESRRFTVPEYERLGELGFFDEDSRIELLRGEIIRMDAIGGPHIKVVGRLYNLLLQSLRDDAFVMPRSSLRLQDSELQPDVLVLKPTEEDNVEVPTADVVFFIAEVCDSSYAKDRDVKLPIYAEAGIQEVWLVHIVGERVEVYRQLSQPDKLYMEKRTYQIGDVIAPGAFPEARIAVADIFRPVLK